MRIFKPSGDVAIMLKDKHVTKEKRCMHLLRRDIVLTFASGWWADAQRVRGVVSMRTGHCRWKKNTESRVM